MKPTYEVWVEKNERMSQAFLKVPRGGEEEEVSSFGDKPMAVKFANELLDHPDGIDRAYVLERRVILTLSSKKNDPSAR